METIEKMMATRRFAYYVPADGYVEGHGYRVSVVFEGVDGHFPTGDWPYQGLPSQKAPWFWGGNDYEFAKRVAADQNVKMGLTEEDAFKIVTSSMAAGHRRRRRRSDAGKRRELP